MSTTPTPSESAGPKARARMALRVTVQPARKPDLVCLSHLRWNSVHQRPHQLMCRFARRTARKLLGDPVDQSGIPDPRLGFFGVIDERMDLALVLGLASARPAWQLVMLGPTAKIDPAELPRRPNIHYLDQKAYRDLPRYLARWDVAILPFARNESTRFTSPTKTAEYLAAGCPVVSTSIRDVVRPYGNQGLVRIADDVADFLRQAEAAILDRKDARWRRAVDATLAPMSWDRTWGQMAALVDEVYQVALRPRADAARARRPQTGEA
jgi:glycosyltransferase involved in cell wall biosynthesis